MVAAGGREVAEGMMSVCPIEGGPEATPEMRAFREKYVASYGKWESNVVQIGIVGFQVIVEAMKKADSIEVDKVVAVLQAGGPFDTILGPAVIGGKELHGVPNQAFLTQAVWQVQNGVGVPIIVLTGSEQLETMLKYVVK
jgi:ABC-type branched-subunit amino acid transport system substrate-binding protein